MAKRTKILPAENEEASILITVRRQVTQTHTVLLHQSWQSAKCIGKKLRIQQDINGQHNRK